MYRFPLARRMKAFTLIELIIVVAIIMILAAILFPTFQRTHCDERRASCQSNLKQICLSTMQYTQDYDDKLPLRQNGANRARGWAAAVEPYLKSFQPFQCPTEATPGKADPAGTAYCDYFINSNLSSFQNGRKLRALPSPALTILLGEAAPFSSSSASNGGTVTAVGPIPVNGTGAELAIAEGRWDPAVSGVRHYNGSNYCFADGHVKWLKPELVTRVPTSSRKFTFRWSAKNPPESGS